MARSRWAQWVVTESATARFPLPWAKPRHLVSTRRVRVRHYDAEYA
ncbi:hypothetical protein JI664_14360 [Rhodobacter sp. NTK016B]|nr:hypothetical protein [Rhodobacter sp. NTK016B]MBN8293154.1 hypothetical protein [Rhodobacter sp. NTK016B]